MRRLQCALLAAVATIGFGSVASAADIPTKAPVYKAPVVAAVNWSGFYVGGHAGYSWTDLDWGLDYTFATPNPLSSSFNLNSGIWGGHAGYQHQFGQWVLGVEGSYSRVRASQTISGINLWAPDVGTLTADISSLYTVTGRAGHAWDRWLAYAKGGYAAARIGLAADDNVPPDFGFDTKNTHRGWTAGFGLEYMITPNVIVGAEYNHVRVKGSVTTPIVVLATGAPTGGTAISDVRTSLNSVMARLSFKFGP